MPRFMSRAALVARSWRSKSRTLKDASGVLFSLHMKATMMKVSDPIIFGHAVRVFFEGRLREARGRSSSSSASTPTTASATWWPRSRRSARGPSAAAIEADIQAALRERGPAIAMVDSDRGITNLHVPSDIIIDASMPPMIRDSGSHVERRRRAAGHQGGHPRLAATPASTPPSCDDCQGNGAVRSVTTMGSVPNVGLMAQKAEEYGSHDKTFEVTGGRNRASRRRRRPQCCWSIRSSEGDIWRACQAKDIADPRLGQARGERVPGPPAMPCCLLARRDRAHDRSS